MACGGCKSKDPTAMPTIPRQALNLGGAVVRTITSAIVGKRVKATQVEESIRLAICKQCPSVRPWERDNDFLRCAECGCWLNGKIKAKARLASESCPLDKWRAIE